MNFVLIASPAATQALRVSNLVLDVETPWFVIATTRIKMYMSASGSN